MKTLRPTALLAMIIFSAGLSSRTAGAAEGEKKPQPRTATEILALSQDDLTDRLGDPSEAGQDRAAQLWARAKQLETENRLAKKDLAMVLELDQWRTVLNHWQDTVLEVGFFQAGGGSMWGHDSARNDATLEEFLAKHAETLGKTLEDPGKSKPLKIAGPVLAAISKGIHFSKEEMKNADAEKEGAELKKSVEEAEAALSVRLAGIPDGPAKEAVIEWAKNAAKMISEP